MDTKRIRGKKKTMKYKTFKESIIDIPRRTYARGVFDNADTKNPTLKKEVRDTILNQIKQFEKEYPVSKFTLIGSILTRRYRNDADLDINVLFDVPKDKQEDERLRLSKKFLSAKSDENINGKLIPGTEHPINYFIITDPEVYKKNNTFADGVFNIKDNKWERVPEKDTFDAEKYEAEFQKRVQEIDVVKGELMRDIIDYKELTDLSDDDVRNLQLKVNDKLEEIEDAIDILVKIGDEVVAQRRDAFAKDMSPDEIREFGKKNKLPKNVIYKMLEKYHYLKFYKKLKEILDDGEVTDKEIDSIKEAVGQSIVITFGRFNPPTVGHEKLIKKVSQTNANVKEVYVSKTQDRLKNPLSSTQKIYYMKKMFPQYVRMFKTISSNLILTLLTDLYKRGFREFKIVVGSDRVREFETIIKRYNGEKNRHGFYDFSKIEIISAGERDPDAEGVTGISASKVRDYVKNNNFDMFKKSIPNLTQSDIVKLFNDLRKGMGLPVKEETTPQPTNEFKGFVDFEQSQKRDLYVREMIFNIGDTVENHKLKLEGKIVRRGTNYIVVEDNENNLHKTWIWDCVPKSSNRDIELREHNLDVDYGFEAVSEIKKTKTYTEKYNKKFNELKKELFNVVKRGSMSDKTKKEAYDIGHDYAKHTNSITPGQRGYDPKHQGSTYKPSNSIDNMKSVSTEDISKWSNSKSTIDKYKKRYGENYKEKLKEDAIKMKSFKDYVKI